MGTRWTGDPIQIYFTQESCNVEIFHPSKLQHRKSPPGKVDTSP
eukprot:COSAG02_NODE_4630_length_5147_cov_1.750594_7_plen_44_part_00